MSRIRYSQGQFPLTKKIEGELWTVYAGRNYLTPENAEQDAAILRSQGYRVRRFSAGGKYFLAWKKS